MINETQINIPPDKALKTSSKEKPLPKIDFERLANEYRIEDKHTLLLYLKEVGKDLKKRSDNPILGIDSHTFSQVKFRNYYNIFNLYYLFFILFLVLSTTWYYSRTFVFSSR